jgi:hypothetical protein
MLGFSAHARPGLPAVEPVDMRQHRRLAARIQEVAGAFTPGDGVGLLFHRRTHRYCSGPTWRLA